MIKKLTHNWQWKLLSLVIAVVLWGMIVRIDDPLQTETYMNIPVTIENEGSITSQGRAIEYLDGTSVTVVVQGKRSVMEKLASDDIRAYADLSRVSITNAIAISIEAGEQVEVLEKEPNEMLIATEQIKSVLKSVQVRYRGELADDYVKLQAVVTPNQIEITGPESKIALVSSVVVPIDLEDANDDVTVFATPELLDSDSNEIRDLDVNNDQIQVKVPIQKIKTIPVSLATTGTLGENYRLISMDIQTKSIVIRGEDEDVDNITKLIVDDVNLSEMSDATATQQINFTNYLPDNVFVYEPQPAITTIEIDIEPVINASKIIDTEDINVRQVPEGLQFSFLDEEPFVIGLRGIYKELEDLTIEEMLPRLNLRDLEVGVHELELELYVPRGFDLSSEVPRVRIELTEIPVDEPEETTEGEPEEGTTTEE